MNLKKTFIPSVLLLLGFVPSIVLAGTSCQAPTVECHEQTIVQLVQEIEQLKKRAADNESYVKQEIALIKNRLDKNETSLKKVKNTADLAVSKAENAEKTAATALSTAQTAQKSADTALDKVEVAQNIADTAIFKAEAAQSTADIAIDKAKVAQNTAKIAMSKAQAANDTNDTTFLVGTLSSATLAVILLILIF